MVRLEGLEVLEVLEVLEDFLFDGIGEFVFFGDFFC
jgi:hypothetical protein